MKFQDFYEQIPWEQLEQKLTERLGFKIKIVERLLSGSRNVMFRSQELKSQTGILEQIYQTLTIEQFSSKITGNKGTYEDEPLQWCFSVCFSFRYTNGGCNAHTVAYYKYTEEKGFEEI